MVEIQLKDLSAKSQRSQFGPVLVGEANALAKQFQKKGIVAPHEILEAHARSNVAHKVYEDRLRGEMDTDPLTGALSRKAIFRGIREALAEVDRNGGHMQVIFMDLNELTKFNNRFGHDVGDAALKILVSGVKQHIRLYDELGRYGGDEFIVLMKKGVPRSANRLMEDLHKTLSELEDPYSGVSTTMGVATYINEMGPITAEQLVHRADQAFYFAKRRNIDTPVTWDSSMKSIEVPK